MMQEMSRVPCFMPLIATIGIASWSRGRGRRPAPAGAQDAGPLQVYNHLCVLW